MRRTTFISFAAVAVVGAIGALAAPDLTRAGPPADATPARVAVAFPCAPLPAALDAIGTLDLTPAAAFRDVSGDAWAIFSGPDGRAVVGFRTGGLFCAIGATDWLSVEQVAVPGWRR